MTKSAERFSTNPGFRLTACGCRSCKDALSAKFYALTLGNGGWSEDEIETIKSEAADLILSGTLAGRIAPYTLKGDA